MFASTSLAYPEPIYLYIKALGKIVTKSGKHIKPEFPPMPTETVNGFGGYYGPLVAPPDEQQPVELTENHNLYEEIPALGVLAEAVRQSVSDNANNGHYAYTSALAPPGVKCNSNLLGYAPITNTRPSHAKNTILSYGITEHMFTESVPGTAINYELIYSVSKMIERTRRFKILNLTPSNLGETGSKAQIIVTRPSPDKINHEIPCIKSVVYNESLTRETLVSYGVATAFSFQMFKEPEINSQLDQSVLHHSWCCVDWDEQHPIPATWINNRNDRRNIMPPQYLIQVFRGMPQNAKDCRSRVVQNL